MLTFKGRRQIKEHHLLKSGRLTPDQGVVTNTAPRRHDGMGIGRDIAHGFRLDEIKIDVRIGSRQRSVETLATADTGHKIPGRQKDSHPAPIAMISPRHAAGIFRKASGPGDVAKAIQELSGMNHQKSSHGAIHRYFSQKLIYQSKKSHCMVVYGNECSDFFRPSTGSTETFINILFLRGSDEALRIGGVVGFVDPIHVGTVPSR
ncbi:MAG: hypothetical protein P4M00_14890 [Azospirillaceae bacterium]|nr:hypothetical protein [Azospirillaceae bacterium]